ncbi:MAG: rcc01693 family protein [Devosia sp.]
MTAFPWSEAMRLGFGVLRLSSREFWGLTPRELAAAFEGLGGRAASPPDRQRLQSLMERFPDGR